MPSITPLDTPAPAATEIPAELVDQQYQEQDVDLQRRFLLFQAAPAWLVSMLIHVLVLLILGLVTVADPVKVVNVLTAMATGEEGPEIEEFAIEVTDPGEISEMEEVTEPVDVTETMELVEPSPVEPMEIATVALDMSDLAAEMAPSASTLQTLASMSMSMSPLGSRSDEMKKKMLRDYGGSASSEAAVQEALKWFSRHQLPNGAWSFKHDVACNGACGNACEPKFANAFNAATAMALLPFLGAGQTHLEGEFKPVVQRGLQFLIQNGKPGRQNGLPVLDYRDGAGNMYSHGLASIVLCEAYAMTQDPALAVPAQASLNFIVYAQCRDGGWRYTPQQDSGGDTSVVGWQVMALKSGYMGHLMVPPPVVQGSILFLDKVQSNNGAVYGYDKPSTSLRPATTAVGLLCRMYTGWDKTHPGIVKGVENLSQHGVSETDLYYDYYAAQVLRQYGGASWDSFNVKLRDFLVAKQDQKAGAKGSWFIPGAGHTAAAGRLCCTSFATMILEVYYRHMPLYADAASEEDFPL
jgi:hypothetical protein